MQNLEIMSDKFNVNGFYIIGNCVQKWITKHYYSFLLPISLPEWRGMSEAVSRTSSYFILSKRTLHERTDGRIILKWTFGRCAHTV